MSCVCAVVSDELRVDVVAPWRFQLVDGRFKLFYCKIARQVGIGGGCSGKRCDFTRRPARGVSVCIWEAAIIHKLRSDGICSYRTLKIVSVVLLHVSLFMACHALHVWSPHTPPPQTTWPCALHPAYGVVLWPLCRCISWWLPARARGGGSCSCGHIRRCRGLVFVEAAWGVLLRCAYKHVAIRCVCGVRVASLWIWETWCSSFSWITPS